MRQASQCYRWLRLAEHQRPVFLSSASARVACLSSQTLAHTVPGCATRPAGLNGAVTRVPPISLRSSAAVKQFSAAAFAAEVEEPDAGKLARSEFEQHGIKYSFENGGLAPMADGSCLAKAGQTWVHAVVSRSVANKFHEKIKPTVHVDYREPVAAVGRMPGGRSKSEGPPNERENDTAIMIEQVVTPLFPVGFTDNVQITATLLCTDGAVAASSVAINAISAALLGSGIPWNGPLAAVQVACAELETGPGPVVVQPSVAQLGNSSMAGLYVGTASTSLLADFQSRGSQVQPNALKPLLQAAHAGTDRLLNAQRELVESQPVQLNTSSTPNSSGYDPAAVAAVTKVAQPLINEVIQQAGMTHMQRAVALQDAKDRTVAKLVKMGIFRNQMNRLRGSGCANLSDVEWAWLSLVKQAVHDQLANENERMDGRGLINARSASYQTGVLPVVHGSVLVSQGDSQALVTAVVGDDKDQAKSEGITGDQSKQLMVQLSDRTAATSQASTSGRDRMADGMRNRINGSHSRLLERSLQHIFPAESFPFAVRLSIDLLAAAGSEHMMALSAASLAMTDAGIPLRSQIAGTQVAAFVTRVAPPEQSPSENSGRGSDDASPNHSDLYDVIVDPQQLECQASDLTMQVTGSQAGIAGLRVEVTQAGGVPLEALQKSIAPAWRNLQQQHSQLEALAQRRSENVPKRVASVGIPQEMVGRLIGPKGSNIIRLRQTTGAMISIAEGQSSPNATVHLFTPASDHVAEVERTIMGVTGADLLEGSVHTVTVKKLMDFGAIVEFPSGSSTLLHISNLSHTRVRSIDDVLSMGQQIQVKVMGHDAKGQLQVSHKAVTAAPFVDETDRPAFPRRSGDGPSRQQRPRPRIPQGA